MTSKVEGAVERDYALIIKSAKQGDAAAQCDLGLMYYHGNGVPQHYELAIQYHIASASQGNANAQYELGLIYYHGNGVPQNYKLAIHYHIESAKQGNAKAQYELGLIYYDEEDLGIRDYKQAYMWLNLAVCNGFEKGRDIRDYIAREMSLDDLEEAQDMALCLFDSNYKDSKPIPPF